MMFPLVRSATPTQQNQSDPQAAPDVKTIIWSVFPFELQVNKKVAASAMADFSHPA
jgi:hypothetical protein